VNPGAHDAGDPVVTETVVSTQPDRRSSQRELEERILVLAPTGDDAALVEQILREDGRDVAILEDLDGLTEAIARHAGAAVVASEALVDRPACGRLRKMLEQQEAWSDLPLLVLGGSGDVDVSQVTELLGASAQVIILERPLGVSAFLTAIDAALRSRRRQYEVRRLLTQLASSAAEVTRAHDGANRAKDEFIATLAHELRSPITAIGGWIQMLKAGELDPKDAAEAIAMIEASAKVQAHIIEDLMDVSRILAGKVMIAPAEVELVSVVNRVVATFRPSAALQGIHLTAEVPAEPVTVWADEVRLQQVGWNLVSNAIKFTPRGGSVHVLLRRDENSAVMRVRDTGQGISPELLPHVFERYRQDEGGKGEMQHGLGLGLSIVCHLVESHGGTIKARSEGRGKGAEFAVTLPLHMSG
jgi:signal transduction histidine kinase